MPTLTQTEVDGARRDRWGRYMVLSPDGGKPQGYTRSTTIAKALDDTSALMSWKARMVAAGLAKRHDLLALVSATTDRRELNALCERAAEAGGATERRDLGTAVHKFVELKVEDPNYLVPEMFAGDVEAILDALNGAGFRVKPGFTEVMVVLDEMKVAGTADLILERVSDGKYFIGDLKTGSSVDYGALAWAIQLSVYANADNIYVQGNAVDGSQDERKPMPDIDRETAIIVHCQPGSAKAELYSLDISMGAEALKTAFAVRGWRSAKNILVPFSVETDNNIETKTESNKDMPTLTMKNTNSDSSSGEKRFDDTPIPGGTLFDVKVDYVRYKAIRPEIRERFNMEDTHQVSFRFRITDDNKFKNRFVFGNARPLFNTSDKCKLRLWLEAIYGVDSLPAVFALEFDDDTGDLRGVEGLTAKILTSDKGKVDKVIRSVQGTATGGFDYSEEDEF